MKFRSKSLILMLALTFVFSMVLSACASGGGESTTPAPKDQGSTNDSKGNDSAKEKEPVTLDVWIMPNSPQPDKDFLNVVQPYLDQNKNVTVNVTVLDWGSAWTKITTAATSGEGPDILQLGTTWVAAISAMDALLPITDKVSEIGGADAYFPATWNTTTIAGEDTVYGAPWFVDARAAYYRTDVFEKAGINPDDAFKTWESFKQALKQINGMEVDGKKISAIGFPGKNDWNVAHNIFPWVWAAGGQILSEDNTEAVFNSEAAVDGIMFYTGLAAEGLAPKSALEQNSAQIEANYNNGDYAVMINGPWVLKGHTTPKDAGGTADAAAAGKTGIRPLPAGPAGSFTFFGGSHLTIFKNSENPEAAWGLIKYLSTKDAQVAYSKASGQLPALKEAMKSDAIMGDANLAQFVKAAENSRSYPSIPQWGPIETVLVKNFGTMWDTVAGVSGTYNRESIKALLDAAKGEVDALLAQ